MLKSIEFPNILITDKFYKRLINLVQEKTLASNIEKCYTTNRIENFKIAAKLSHNQFSGKVYNDSDVYKLLEGIAYSLQQNQNSVLESQADEIIDYIYKAQEPNGYICTKYTILGSGHFTNMDEHEMYNGGHLIEAGIAYFIATKKDKLLNVGIKFANHIIDVFGNGSREWVPGHQEIELALIKLGELLNEKKYIEFANHLIGNRGKNLGSKDTTKNTPVDWNKEYYQDLIPAEQLEKITGHAVRAMYMFSAMADISKHLNVNYLQALKKLWYNVVHQNMYITGGIGSSKTNEGFVADYDLPNDTAYCETCASVGMVYWGTRMFYFLKESNYLDIVEKELFNGIISGLGQDGVSFFYDNPLASHGKTSRQPWFETSCCPTQLSRFIPSIANYIYAYQDDKLYINTFIPNTLNHENINLTISGNFPNNGKIIINANSSKFKQLAIRIPEWANTIPSPSKVNGAAFSKLQNGFLIFDIEENFYIEIEFTMYINFVHCNTKVKANLGKVALQYGPVVYCLEGQDCYQKDFALTENQSFKINEEFDPFKGYAIIEVYSKLTSSLEARFIPYFLWNNRGTDTMNVYVEYKNEDLLYFR